MSSTSFSSPPSSPTVSSPCNANVTVRPAALSDLDLLVQMQVELARETEHREIDPARCRGALARLLPAADGSSTACRRWGADLFVAEIAAADASGGGGNGSGDNDGSSAPVVGAMSMATYELNPWRGNAFTLWIQGVYTSDKFRGRGLFKAIYARFAEIAAANKGGMRLVADKANKGGIRTYEKLGMFLEPESRVYRFTLPAFDSPRADKEPFVPLPIDPTIDAMAAELSARVRIATPEDVESIVAMQIPAAKRMFGLQLDEVITRRGFVDAIEKEQRRNDAADPILSQVLVIDGASAGHGVIASCSIFQENDDWRFGLIAWITSFAVAEPSATSTTAAATSTVPPRSALFLAIIKHLQRRMAAPDSAWVGMRCEIDPARDEAAFAPADRIVPVVLSTACNFVEEDDRFMRWDSEKAVKIVKQ